MYALCSASHLKTHVKTHGPLSHVSTLTEIKHCASARKKARASCCLCVTPIISIWATEILFSNKKSQFLQIITSSNFAKVSFCSHCIFYNNNSSILSHFITVRNIEKTQPKKCSGYLISRQQQQQQ